MSIHFRRGRGFTLVEMLVVIAIIGVLVALLLPGVQMARESARRSKCTNNLRNLALAVQSFESAYNKLPPNRFGGCGGSASLYGGAQEDSRSWSWITMILPYIAQKDVYDQVENYSKDPAQPTVRLKLAINDNIPPTLPTIQQALYAPGKTLASWEIPLLWCPSDSLGTKKSFNEQTAYMRGVVVGLTNYKGSRGAFYVVSNPSNQAQKLSHPKMNGKPPTGSNPFCYNDGVLIPEDPLKNRSFSNTVKDGLTKTFLIGEQFWSQNRSTCAQRSQPGAGMGFAWAHSIEAGAFGGPPLNWKPPYTEAQMDAEGNALDGPDECSFEALNGFSSRHTNGAMFAACDASVKFVSNNVDIGVYRAQFTVNGGKYDGPSNLDQ
jgi:prepilin-type N-terminal cleavage/methylation domain-containing protein